MENTSLLVTSALPYANGPLHIGHILEFIQTDMYVRFMKLLNTNVVYMGGADMHGTPIEIKAKAVGEKPRTFALKFYKKQKEVLENYLINFDNYYHTDTPENQELAEFFYTELKKKGHITRKKMTVMYCESCKRFLPDRFVKGSCPHCGEDDQYGDICEKCNTVLKGIDLIEPHCVLCAKNPIQKESEHYFFTLKKFSKRLETWMNDPESGVQPEIKNWLCGWIKNGLDDWCISRDAPYYGFEIPDSVKETGEKKYFYVWLDAPIGYISSTKKWCDKHGKDWKEYWYKGRVQHFIGKDIVYFHYLFWPAMFMGMDIPLPKLLTHGFVNVNGTKMSKSRGTFFTAEDFLKLFPAELLRFYYASHLDTKVSDIDLQFDDFKAVINNVLMGNLGNFCYRTLTFAQKNYDSLDENAVEGALVKKINGLIEKTKKEYNVFNFKSAVKNILQIADVGNAYFQKTEPWKNKETSAAQVNFCVNIARNLSILVQPILPEFAMKVQKALGEKNLVWDDINFQWKGTVGKVAILVTKVDKVPEMKESSSKNEFPLHMKVGKIIDVKNHPDADKLYVLKVDFKSEKRQVVAGLREHFYQKDLEGMKAVFCVNLAKAKIRGEVSEAMVMVAEDGEHVELLNVGSAKVGDDVQFEGLSSSHKEVSFNDFLKIKMTVKDGHVIYNKAKMVTSKGSVKVKKVKDGSKIC
ncbi:methionine--tRNA ligase [Candidatus Woesearchaeota archaeon]|jgi:methionyl-tRNA synthetase|nr:methionine--tRNA ligase [Candidatus Woesearchaeota archaeon]MBT5397011.1 methionine--tRNA ligase [Candidatus Woesearchaeota archaeon]MBT5924119.1 methionine--tRNA ligase [Candidatus Woesearchaeota archaeon]MBT6367443.1 methionine--tRNA ligase [Candidatus Woesearchaeota archaeon]MBT7762411.1 methionine--tRNA ligase [Candidatus Woesearchaeota archaeon]